MTTPIVLIYRGIVIGVILNYIKDSLLSSWFLGTLVINSRIVSVVVKLPRRHCPGSLQLSKQSNVCGLFLCAQTNMCPEGTQSTPASVWLFMDSFTSMEESI